MVCEPAGVKGPVDFTGYWCLAKQEGMDEFLKAAGFPWVVRKAALKFGGSAVDVCAHAGCSLRVTSLNAKGSWTRCYDTEREVTQENAEGTACKTTAWWEGRVLCSRMEGSRLGVLQSWRYMQGSSMCVRTCLRPARGGPEAIMFWFFDRMETLQRHVARGGMGRRSLRQQIESDQRRVERATRRDTEYIQAVLLDWQRWKSPADEFIHVVSPPPMGRPSRLRRPRSPGSASPRTMSPASLSKSPSNDSLAALPAGVEVRSDAKSARSDSRGRLAESELSVAALDRAARQAAALALGPPPPPVAAATSGPASPPPPAQQPAAAAAEQQQQQQRQQQQQQPGGSPARSLNRDATLSYPRDDSGGIPVERSPPKAAPQADSLTFRPSGGVIMERLPSGAMQAVPPPPESDAATRGSVHGSLPPHGAAHQRTASAGSAAALRPTHYKSLSADSGRGGAASASGRASPRSTPAASHHHLTPAEHLMACRLHEFGDSRGIAAVVPVSTPNDTSEPQLLSMSPEQAEETAAKLRELEADMLLSRQENRRGWSLCGCLVVTLASDTLPDHLRVWEQMID